MTRIATKTPRTRFLLGLAAAATLAATAGCAGAGSDSNSSATSADEAPAVAADEPAPDAAGELENGRALVDGVDATLDTASLADGKTAAKGEVDGPAVISTGTVSLEAKDVGKARFEVRKIIDKYHGTVTEQETTTGEKGEVATARLVMRVPSERFADATADLEDVATLTDSTSESQDVTAKVVDVEARIRAQRKSVSRIETLLARAENLNQVVSIEGQLASRQADLDALLARQNYLADQTSQSTITVYVQQPDEEKAEPKDDSDRGFLTGLRDGWDSFVTGFVVALTVVGFLLPWLIVVAVLGYPLWLVLRRRVRRPADQVPAATATPAAP